MEELKDHQQQETGGGWRAAASLTPDAGGTHARIFPGLQLGGSCVEDLLCSLFSLSSHSVKSVPALPGDRGCHFQGCISDIFSCGFSAVESLSQSYLIPSHLPAPTLQACTWHLGIVGAE